MSIGRTAFTLLPYAALTFFLAVVSRSTVVAIGGGLAYAMLIEGCWFSFFAFVGGTWLKLGNICPPG
ncbi:MAG: hypothetical protein H6656_07880 [Ardenticatenaceae bacterium]|nr:hypothetical protein [Ardenticatenaceae bacterium]